MTPHRYLAPTHIRRCIRRGEIALAGNAVLKIYGRLSCASGKRMNKNNRVFFANLAEAARHGYRPCGHCMRPQYEAWKSARSRLRTEGADTTFDLINEAASNKSNNH